MCGQPVKENADTMINVTALHKSGIAYFQQKTHLSDYSVLWITFIKGLLIGLLIYHFFLR